MLAIALGPTVSAICHLRCLGVKEDAHAGDPLGATKKGKLGIAEILDVLKRDIATANFLKKDGKSFVQGRLMGLNIHSRFIGVTKRAERYLTFLSGEGGRARVLRRKPFVSILRRRRLGRHLHVLVPRTRVLVMDNSVPLKMSCDLCR